MPCPPLCHPCRPPTRPGHPARPDVSHPDTIARLRAILRDYDTGTHDLGTAVELITDTVKRDGIRWARDHHRGKPSINPTDTDDTGNDGTGSDAGTDGGTTQGKGR